jgi:hypothetical protein
MAFQSTYFRSKVTGKTAAGADLLTVYTVPSGKVFLCRGLYLFASVDVTTGAGAGTALSVYLFPYVLPSGGTDATADQASLARDIANGATVVPLAPESMAQAVTEDNSSVTGREAAGTALLMSAPGNVSPVHREAGFAKFNLTSAFVLNASDALKIERHWLTNGGTYDITTQCMLWGEEF